MKTFIKNIFLTVLVLTSACIVSACSSSHEDEVTMPDGMSTLAFHIMPVDIHSRVSDGQPVNEMITSFRIILVNESEVEFNKLRTIDVPGGILATDFQYDFIHMTDAGEKKVYFIANEESVANVVYDNLTLPEDFSSGDSFSDLLDCYSAGYSDLTDMENTLAGVYFSPTYSPDSNNNLYLPYSSVYGNLILEENSHEEMDLYIVPVATKFIFNFTNTRERGVYVEEISINSVNTSNYIWANVGETDKFKKLPGSSESLYWVDWLAKVSELSHSDEGTGYYPNIGFNQKYGWIKDYFMPDPTGVEPRHVFLAQEESFLLPGELDEGSNTCSTGPFYLPESRTNLRVSDNSEIPDQNYTLTLGLKDSVDGKVAPTFTDVDIPNLASLFRNTSVIINIKFSQGEVEVYAEITPWNVKSANGWVTEGGKPNL